MICRGQEVPEVHQEHWGSGIRLHLPPGELAPVVLDGQPVGGHEGSVTSVASWELPVAGKAWAAKQGQGDLRIGGERGAGHWPWIADHVFA